MAREISVQDGGITFGRWKLFPLDDRNWELCVLRETADTANARKAGTVGVVKWQRCGRYYQYNTFRLALEYAADCDLKDKVRIERFDIYDAIAMYDDIMRGLMREFGDELAYAQNGGPR